ncbi:hypothetical protein H6F42_07370 [Pseudanabaena sp. FACHB-1998]|uniref:hypothetical protein n=1 Tax=Pseudanabaena sp. FACHB-1998 TaxID=2692858 RepID=UPI001680641A|nr:hypothetical protein [Pseudanabaena sp. FACHB-1998]MBD2176732.1 hypothetical protein [Pseudanabaena sp. FACHB-1998]
MKNKRIHYNAIIYLIILFLGYVIGGYLLAVYNVNYLLLLGTFLVTLRLAQTGSSSIALAIAWISLWFWGSAFVWAKPIVLGDISAQNVAFLLLLCWALSVGIIFLLAFANKRMYKLGLDHQKSTYGLLIIVWGAIVIGWNIYQRIISR